MNVVLFLILSSSVCICSKKDWENLVDRIDLLITDSFLIIQCNEHEIQVIRRVTTFEEFESNLKCTNKENIVSHGIERVQIIDFSKVIISCKNNEIVHLEGNFKRVKAALNKKENQVDWPFVHTPFTKDIQIIDPNKMKFFSEKQIDLTLTEINIDQLPQVKNNFFIYLDFVNRPMICRIRINGLHKKLKNEKCDAHILDEVNEPMCYYKVGEQNPVSHEELIQIADQIRSYVEKLKSNYAYISDINQIVDFNNDDKQIISTEKGNQSRKASSKRKKETESNPIKIIIILILIICLIVLLLIGIIYLYKKPSQEKSDSSFESQISQLSKTSNSIKSEKDFSSSPLKPFPHNQQKTPQRIKATNYFKFDEDI